MHKTLPNKRHGLLYSSYEQHKVQPPLPPVQFHLTPLPITMTVLCSMGKDPFLAWGEPSAEAEEEEEEAVVQQREIQLLERAIRTNLQLDDVDIETDNN